MSTISAAVPSSRWPMVLLVVGAGVVSAFQVGKAPAALAAVQADLHLDLAAGSWLLSAFAIVGAVAGIAVGIAVGQMGAKRTVVGGLLLQGACCVVGAFTVGPSLLLISRAVEGIGFLAVTVAAPAMIISVAAPRDLGRAIALWGTFMPVGTALVMLGSPLLGVIGWRGFWLANAVILVLYALVMALQSRAIAVEHVSRRPIGHDVRQTISAPAPWLLAGIFAACTSAYFAVFAFLPIILSQQLAVTPEIGSMLAALAVASHAAGNLSCGHLLARGIKRHQILLSAFAVMVVCGIGILRGQLPGEASYLLCIVFSAICGWIPVTLMDSATLYAPRPALVGATMGLLMQGSNAGLVIGPVLGGALAASGDWSMVAWLVVAVSLIAAVLIGVLLRSAPARSLASQGR